ncbi:MAG: 2-amino-4-hydroxy-6-hydroxymethyldihydropteridine diphosphokinase [Candidatus Omnitrophica bacterium]|nr:2-amino-4-hydroxy-6-hydroxymethyldihydropteridine diphosphokinase [Candidatus Omnitrophota bacterium]
MPNVFIGIGSNLGKREDNIKQSLKLIKKKGISIKKVSSIIETEPEGGPRQGKFLNTAAHIQTKLSPLELLKELKSIEKEMGRVKGVKNGPRIIDLDILLYDDLKFKSPRLTIPHPRMYKREFVMVPLKEIIKHPKEMPDENNQVD